MQSLGVDPFELVGAVAIVGSVFALAGQASPLELAPLACSTQEELALNFGQLCNLRYAKDFGTVLFMTDK